MAVTVTPTTVSIVATTNTATENGSAAGKFTITRAGGTATALAVNFGVSGTATEGTDYVAIGTVATIPAGATSVEVLVTGKDDSVFESDESVVLTLATGPGYSIGGTGTASVTIIDDESLVLVSGPTATPNPAQINSVVQFSCNSNASGATTYAWDFGDGSTDNSGAASVSHTYTSASVFTVKVTGTANGKSVTQSLSLLVRAPGTGPSGVDTDNDGVSDDIENLLGTDPLNAASTPVTNALNPKPLTVSKLAISLNFASGGKDAIGLSGTLEIPNGFVFGGAKIGVDVGGVVNAFTLDAKGKSKNGFNAFTIATKPKNGVSKFAVKISKGTFSDRLADEKLTNTTVSGLSTTVTVNMIFNGELYQKVQGQIYKATQGKSGKSK